MLRLLFSKFRNLFSPESNYRDEIEAHLDLLTARFEQQGMSPAEARNAAHRQFGNASLHEQRLSEMRIFLSLTNLGRDLRLGVRQLRRSPLLAIIAITSLALGIGANTAIFTVAKSVLLDTLPVDHPQQLRTLAWVSGHERVLPLVWAMSPLRLPVCKAPRSPIPFSSNCARRPPSFRTSSLLKTSTSPSPPTASPTSSPARCSAATPSQRWGFSLILAAVSLPPKTTAKPQSPS